MIAITEAPSTLVLDGSNLPERSLVGGKAWSIAHMMHLGLRVPPAFVITAPSNARYLEEGRLWPSLLEEIQAGIEAYRRQRRRPTGSNKESTTMRFDREVLAAFRAGGPGWQTRINAVLRDWLKTQSPV